MLDPDVLKVFKIVLVTADRQESEINPDLYAELITPEVFVMSKKGDLN